MNKTITPVISVILLILITIVASGSAYFFITSTMTDLQGGVDPSATPFADNSKLNLVSVTGSKAIIRNDGNSPVNDIVIFINGELFNYTLDSPILPGQYKEINYIAQMAGEDLEIKIMYGIGKTVESTSPARLNTLDSGFTLNLGPQVSYSSISQNTTHLNGYCLASVYNSSFDSIYYYEWLLNDELNESGIVVGNHDSETFLLSSMDLALGSWSFKCMISNGVLNSSWVESSEHEVSCITGCTSGWEDTIELASVNTINNLDYSVNKSNVYIIWSSIDSGYYSIFFKNSSDYGETWSSARIISPQDSHKSKFSIDSWDNNVYVILQNIDTSLYFMNSSNNGLTWSSEIKISGAITSCTNPVIKVNPPYIHVVWIKASSNHDLYYVNSSDNGLTWNTPVMLSSGDGYEYVYSPSLSVSGNYINIVWDNHQTVSPNWDDIYYISSSDNGISWSSSKNLTYDSYQSDYSSVISSGNKIFVPYFKYSEDLNEIRILNSSNNGASFSDNFFATGLGSYISSDSQNVSLMYSCYSDSGYCTKGVYFSNSYNNGNSWQNASRISNLSNSMEIFKGGLYSQIFHIFSWETSENFINYKRGVFLSNSIDSVCGDGICDYGESCSIDCSPEPFCFDGIDNDLNGYTDREDNELGNLCHGIHGDGYCDEGESSIIDCSTETYCEDGVDNDKDWNTDCEDDDCLTEPICQVCEYDLYSCPDYYDCSMYHDMLECCTQFPTCECDILNCTDYSECSTYHSSEDCCSSFPGDPACTCGDEMCDWGEECSSDCFDEIGLCDDGADNDEDTMTDCDDSDCIGDSACPELDCSNMMDDDGDFLTDCEDDDCDTRDGGGFNCEYGMEMTCDDGYDNDANGFYDCESGFEDPNCNCV